MTTLTRSITLDPHRLIHARLAAGYTRQIAFARALGYGDVCTVRHWERGDSEPSLYNFVRICRTLGITPNELLGWED